MALAERVHDDHHSEQGQGENEFKFEQVCLLVFACQGTHLNHGCHDFPESWWGRGGEHMRE